MATPQQVQWWLQKAPEVPGSDANQGTNCPSLRGLCLLPHLPTLSCQARLSPSQRLHNPVLREHAIHMFPSSRRTNTSFPCCQLLCLYWDGLCLVQEWQKVYPPLHQMWTLWLQVEPGKLVFGGRGKSYRVLLKTNAWNHLLPTHLLCLFEAEVPTEVVVVGCLRDVLPFRSSVQLLWRRPQQEGKWRKVRITEPAWA